MPKKHVIHLSDAELRLILKGLKLAVDCGPVDDSKSELREWHRIESIRLWLTELQENRNKPWGTSS